VIADGIGEITNAPICIGLRGHNKGGRRMELEESKEFFEYLCWEISKGMLLLLLIILSLGAVMYLWLG